MDQMEGIDVNADPAARYAASVIRVLNGHFPALLSSVNAQIIAFLVAGRARDPQPHFEVIIDTPASARWRLLASPRRVRLACHHETPLEADTDLGGTVNQALHALDEEPVGPGPGTGDHP